MWGRKVGLPAPFHIDPAGPLSRPVERAFGPADASDGVRFVSSIPHPATEKGQDKATHFCAKRASPSPSAGMSLRWRLWALLLCAFATCRAVQECLGPLRGRRKPCPFAYGFALMVASACPLRQGKSRIFLLPERLTLSCACAGMKYAGPVLGGKRRSASAYPLSPSTSPAAFERSASASRNLAKLSANSFRHERKIGSPAAAHQQD